MSNVPDNTIFNFQHVTTAVYGDTNAGRNLVSAFADATGTFDPAYVGLKTNLLNFTNYNSTPTPTHTPTPTPTPTSTATPVPPTPTPTSVYFGYTVNEYLAPYPAMTCTANGNRTIANTVNTAVVGQFYRSNNGADDCVFEILTSGVDVSGEEYLITSIGGAGFNTCVDVLPLVPA